VSKLWIPSDTREHKFGKVAELAKEIASLPPIYVITHKRSKTLPTLKTLPFLRDMAKFVVAEEELSTYRDDQPGLDYLRIPSGYRGYDRGVGRARQFCLDDAWLNGAEDHVLILDDDLTSLSVLYGIGEGKVSHAYARAWSGPKGDFFGGLLVAVALAAEEAYDAHPEAVIASPQCNNANRTTGSSETRWELNRGGPPAQIQSWRVDRFADRCGELDLKRFNYHGDDIGVAAQIIAAGGSVVNVPSVIGQYLDYETESVIRSAATAPALRAAEHEALMSHELADYVTTREDILGRPQWHSLDWRKLVQRKKIPSDKVRWDDLT
jgi:hypothetical protein